MNNQIGMPKADPKVLNANAKKTHCPQGHPYSEENTYISPQGDRKCRICTRISLDKSYAVSGGFNQTYRDSIGWTTERFAVMLYAQGGVCYICGEGPAYTLVRDHDHDTNEPRALLHNNCNSGIGLLGDSSTVLEDAARYLKMFGK